jgi:hypothetical protein
MTRDNLDHEGHSSTHDPPQDKDVPKRKLNEEPATSTERICNRAGIRMPRRSTFAFGARKQPRSN